MPAANGRFNGAGDADDVDRWGLLDRLLAEQHFRLCFWKVAGDEINYRRFFAINDLVSLRAEQEEVFDHTHELILKLVEEGAFTGLRVDHIDGLYDPSAYLERLRGKTGDAYLAVEKILTGFEPLPAFWPVQGSTGYDFLALVCNLLVARDNEAEFDAIYSAHTGRRLSVKRVLAQKKVRLIDRHIAGDVDNLARLVKQVSSRDRRAWDITLRALTQAISELLVYFPAYRTYLSHDAFRPVDMGYIRSAVRNARRRNPELRAEFDFLERFLLLEFDERMSEDDRRAWTHFVMRFQQITGPLQAKAMEDTTFYVVNRLLCLNEVGGGPGDFGVRADDFHRIVAERGKVWPHALNATATHDAKRGEDARMRLAALSELPGEWAAAIKSLRAASSRVRRQLKNAPRLDPNDEYFLFQTLLASWPDDAADPAAMARYRQRLEAYLIKAVREGKENSSWIEPDQTYEDGYLAFARSLLRPGERNPFLRAFLPLQARVARLGMSASLAQTLIKIAAPGLPDFYQGTELWDLSFVDPDNRRPVDFGLRAERLDALVAAWAKDPCALAESLVAAPRDGRVKLFLIWRGLAVRRENARLFREGAYSPLAFSGRHARSCFGFARTLEGRIALAVVPRFVSRLGAEGFALGEVWEDTALRWPERLPGEPLAAALVELEDAFTGRRFQVEPGGPLPLRDLLRCFPAALLA